MQLDELQAKVKDWADQNFGPSVAPYHRNLLGLMEELGELAHAHLKREQGIRGTAEEHDSKAKDAIGDMMIFLMNYCSDRDWSLGEITQTTWEEVVRKRDWKANPTDGVAS